MPDLMTQNLALPLIAAAQAQKHITHNEALVKLDLITQLSVRWFAAVTPPETPEEGDAFALGVNPTGVWSGNSLGTIASFVNGHWSYVTPKAGWSAAHRSTGQIWTFRDGNWHEVGQGSAADPETLPFLGLNASADSYNRLSINAAATLLNNEGAGHQLKLNKAASSDTASLLFQTDFSGRAEMGTAGGDDFSVKVSADGVDWHEAILVDAASGAVAFPAGATAPLQLPLVGRWNCETTNDWTGFHNHFGSEGGSHSRGAGTNAEPAAPAWADLGLPLSGDTRLDRLQGHLRVNSSEVTALDIRMQVKYGQPDGTLAQSSDVTLDTLWSVNGLPTPGTGFYPLSVDLGGYVVPRDAILMVYIRPVGTLTSRRYAYLSTTLKGVSPA